ncbi:DNA-binding protein WhiA [Mycoplasma phocimorsus]|uniref:DNA-binding protein WhiA n=1 Tax=Mycoplasma phocimorsus TaxID=3045839 RepID=UPI0024C0A389|nr:DNA-binding protein WhiA [Mycoplasma phocimorsus]MDJ1648221.1 DNA-binding protein WhiA [Mycoplasma phocimorsus]
MKIYQPQTKENYLTFSRKEIMTFAHSIKNEIMTTSYSKTQLDSLLNGFIISNGILQDKNIILKFNNSDIRKFILKIFSDRNIDFAKVANTKSIIINTKNYDFSINYEDNSQFFAGIFLSSGSVNKLETSAYHLQIGAREEKFIDIIQKTLNSYENFKFKFIKQKDWYIIYIKKIESICDFLRAIQAINSYLLLENVRINRDYNNNLNRLGNFDVTNLNKTIKAFEDFKNMFLLVKEKKQLKQFSQSQRVYFKERMKHPEYSLSELSILLLEKGIDITKGGINHWNKKLKTVFEQLLTNQK